MLTNNKDYFVLNGKADGPRVLILGAVHGNELCGPLALERWLQNPPVLTKGKVTVIPVCNAKAYAQNKRQIDENLNRVFMKRADPQTYEQRLANELVPFVDDADYILDLHSMPSAGDAFAFCDVEDKRHLNWVRALGLKYTLFGWADVVPVNGALSTNDYARVHNKASVTVECGEHTAPEAINAALSSIALTLAHLGMINEKPAMLCTNPKSVRMTDVIRFEGTGDFVKPWQNFEPVKKGEAITTTYQSPKNALIVLPSITVRPIVGTEWFYLGQEENP